MEESSWRNHQVGIINEESSSRNHQGGIIKEESLWRTHHGGGIVEESKSSLGAVWELSEDSLGSLEAGLGWPGWLAGLSWL